MKAAPPRAQRVTQCVFDFEGGGLETVVAQLSRHFALTGMQITILTFGGREGRMADVVRDYVERITPVPYARGLSMFLPRSIRDAIRGTQPDVVHLHSGAWFKPAWAARLAGVPRVIYTEHGREHDDPVAARWIDRLAALLTDSVVAVSTRLHDYLRDVVKIDARRLCVIENGVDTEVFSPGEARELRQRLQLGDAFVIGTAGRLEPVKAYHRLIQAFAQAQRLDPGRRAVLVIAGDGSERGALETLARQLGVAENVRFPGWLDRPSDLYRALDVFSLTSISEGMSISLLEAMSAGALPAVMDVGANAEILGSGLRGQVVPAGDVSGLAQLIVTAARNAAETRELRRIARARVESRYSVSRMAAAYRRVYAGEAA